MGETDIYLNIAITTVGWSPSVSLQAEKKEKSEPLINEPKLVRKKGKKEEVNYLSFCRHE